VTLTGTEGTVVLAANQSGNTNYKAATEVTTSFTVAKISQTISAFAAITSKAPDAAPFTITPPTATSGLPVTVTVKSGPATISGNTITLNGTSGTVVLAANQGGNGSYLAATEKTISFDVEYIYSTVTTADHLVDALGNLNGSTIGSNGGRIPGPLTEATGEPIPGAYAEVTEDDLLATDWTTDLYPSLPSPVIHVPVKITSASIGSNVLTISGIATVNVSILITINGVEHSVTANASGVWTYSQPVISDTSYTVAVSDGSNSDSVVVSPSSTITPVPIRPNPIINPPINKAPNPITNPAPIVNVVPSPTAPVWQSTGGVLGGGGATPTGPINWPSPSITNLSTADACINADSSGLGSMKITGTVNMGTTTDTYIGGRAFGYYIISIPTVGSFMLLPGTSQDFIVTKTVQPGSGSISFTPSSSFPHDAGSSQTGSAVTITVPQTCKIGFANSSYGDGSNASIIYTGDYLSATYKCRYLEGVISQGCTITNTVDRSITITVEGGADDDVMFNGVVYEAGAYLYFSNGKNGAHNFSYTTTLAAFDSLLIQGVDNGYGGSIDCTISIH
jgi:hypothetical protein